MIETIKVHIASHTSPRRGAWPLRHTISGLTAIPNDQSVLLSIAFTVYVPFPFISRCVPLVLTKDKWFHIFFVLIMYIPWYVHACILCIHRIYSMYTEIDIMYMQNSIRYSHVYRACSEFTTQERELTACLQLSGWRAFQFCLERGPSIIWLLQEYATIGRTCSSYCEGFSGFRCLHSLHLWMYPRGIIRKCPPQSEPRN